MTKYQDNNYMLSLDQISELEELLNDKKYDEVIALLEEDPGYALYVSEGSAFSDYVLNYTLDTNREPFGLRLLKIRNRAGYPVFSLRIVIAKDSGNLWHKIWEIEVN